MMKEQYRTWACLLVTKQLEKIIKKLRTNLALLQLKASMAWLCRIWEKVERDIQTCQWAVLSSSGNFGGGGAWVSNWHWSSASTSPVYGRKNHVAKNSGMSPQINVENVGPFQQPAVVWVVCLWYLGQSMVKKRVFISFSPPMGCAKLSLEGKNLN